MLAPAACRGAEVDGQRARRRRSAVACGAAVRTRPWSDGRCCRCCGGAVHFSRSAVGYAGSGGGRSSRPAGGAPLRRRCWSLGWRSYAPLSAPCRDEGRMDEGAGCARIGGVVGNAAGVAPPQSRAAIGLQCISFACCMPTCIVACIDCVKLVEHVLPALMFIPLQGRRCGGAGGSWTAGSSCILDVRPVRQTIA